MWSSRCVRFAQLALAVYIGSSVLYVSVKVFSPFVCIAIPCPTYSSPGWMMSAAAAGATSLRDSDPGKPKIQPDNNPQRVWSLNDTTVAESLFLSKAFSNSHHPNQIMPFYYRASGDMDKEDITITTLVTMDRFPAFRRLVERYQGMLSTFSA